MPPFRRLLRVFISHLYCARPRQSVQRARDYSPGVGLYHSVALFLTPVSIGVHSAGAITGESDRKTRFVCRYPVLEALQFDEATHHIG